MYKLCKTEQSARRQKQLEDGLLNAMTQQRYEDISVSDLCDQMNIPRKSFYRYFSSKDGALHALLDHTILDYERIALTIVGGQPLSVEQEMTVFFSHWLEHRRLLDALERSGMSGMLVERAVNQAHKEITPPRFVHPKQRQLYDHTLAFLTCGIMSMAIQWHHQGYQQTPGEIAKIAAHILTQPLASFEFL